MKQHNGMSPHDILILLKIISMRNEPWLNKNIASDLYISPSEVSESLNHSQIAGLIGPVKRKVQRGALLDFLVHGLKYVFPAVAEVLRTLDKSFVFVGGAKWHYTAE